jgi:hypothetical protein
MQDNKKMDTLSERMNYLRTKGFSEEFSIKGNRMETQDGSHQYKPDDITVCEHYRFEGESDPGDMTVLYAVETNDGTKGMLIDGFGTYSDPKQAEFMQRIREMHNKDIY